MEGLSLKKYYVAILHLFIPDLALTSTLGDISSNQPLELSTEVMSIKLRKYLIKENMCKGDFLDMIASALNILSSRGCTLSWKTNCGNIHTITSKGYRLLTILLALPDRSVAFMA
jgi:hypothetical protein